MVNNNVIYNFVGYVHDITYLQDYFKLEDDEDKLLEEMRAITTPAGYLFRADIIQCVIPFLALGMASIKIIDGYRYQVGVRLEFAIRRTVQEYCIPDTNKILALPVTYIPVTSMHERENIVITELQRQDVETVQLGDFMTWLAKTFPKISNLITTNINSKKSSPIVAMPVGESIQ